MIQEPGSHDRDAAARQVGERDLRRWPRLHPEDFSLAQVRLLHRGGIAAELVDWSPMGIALHLPAGRATQLAPGEVHRLEIRLGRGEVYRVQAEIRKLGPGARAFQTRAGFQFLSHVPEEWSGRERRVLPRLPLPPEIALWIRIPQPHLHRTWIRGFVVDLSADQGFRCEIPDGAAFLLPGMEVDLHLDLPIVHDIPLRSEVLWLQSHGPSAMRFGLRGLDDVGTFRKALEEWLVLRRRWSPEALRALGFPVRALPGQLRFRRMESLADYDSSIALRERDHFRYLSGTRGWDELLEEAARGELRVVGAWDQARLVGVAVLDAHASRHDATFGPDDVLVAALAVEWAWFGPSLLSGLFEQIVRVFLVSGGSRLWVWCPAEQERLFRRIGLLATQGPRPLEPEGTWTTLTRERILCGDGMPFHQWSSAFQEVSRFALRREGIRLPWTWLLRRWARIALSVALSDLVVRHRRAVFARIDAWGRRRRD